MRTVLTLLVAAMLATADRASSSTTADDVPRRALHGDATALRENGVIGEQPRVFCGDDGIHVLVR